MFLRLLEFFVFCGGLCLVYRVFRSLRKMFGSRQSIEDKLKEIENLEKEESEKVININTKKIRRNKKN